jgi:hypothetical protein
MNYSTIAALLSGNERQIKFSTQRAKFAPTNWNLHGSVDANLNGIAFDLNDRDRNSSPDDDGFTVLSR